MSVPRPSDVPDFMVEARRPRLREAVPLRARRAWLRLRYGRRLSVGRGAYFGPGQRLELRPGARLELEAGAWLGAGSRIRATGVVRFGERTFVGRGCAVVATREVCVGAGCVLADEVMLSDTSLTADDVEDPACEQPPIVAPVRVADGARIGPRACLLAGASLGDQAVLGARAVLGCEAPPRSVLVGVPTFRWDASVAGIAGEVAERGADTPVEPQPGGLGAAPKRCR